MELLTNLLYQLSIAERPGKLGMLCESTIRIFEHVLYGNPPQTINQWITAQGGWVCLIVLLYFNVALFKSI